MVPLGSAVLAGQLLSVSCVVAGLLLTARAASVAQGRSTAKVQDASEGAALLALVFCGSSAFLGWYAFEIRMYAPMFFFGSLGLWAVVGRRPWTAVMSGVLMLSVHHYGLLWAVGLATWLFRQRQTIPPPTFRRGMAVLGFFAAQSVVLAIVQLDVLRDAPGQMPTAWGLRPIATVALKFLAFATGAFVRQETLLYGLCLVAALTSVFLVIRGNRDRLKPLPPGCIPAGVALALAIGGHLFAGLPLRPYPLLFLLPTLSVGLAIGTTRLPPGKRRLAVIFWCGGNAILGLMHNASDSYAKPDIRAVAAIIAETPASEALLIKIPEILPGCGHFPFFSWKWTLADHSVTVEEWCPAKATPRGPHWAVGPLDRQEPWQAYEARLPVDLRLNEGRRRAYPSGIEGFSLELRRYE